MAAASPKLWAEVRHLSDPLPVSVGLQARAGTAPQKMDQFRGLIAVGSPSRIGAPLVQMRTQSAVLWQSSGPQARLEDHRPWSQSRQKRLGILRTRIGGFSYLRRSTSCPLHVSPPQSLAANYCAPAPRSDRCALQCRQCAHRQAPGRHRHRLRTSAGTERRGACQPWRVAPCCP